MRISIVIVSYRVRHYLRQCLHALRRSIGELDTEVFVVDNGSEDGTVEMLREDFPWVKLIVCEENMGFSRANNLAIRQSQGEYVLLLNPDTLVGEHTLRDTLAFMDSHKEGGALGVRMLDAHGFFAKESRRGMPSPMVSLYKMVGLSRLFPHSSRFGHYYMGSLSWEEPAEIEVVSGAFCLVRRTALDKVGLLDESFFMYGEDIDLSYRLLEAGYKNYFYPTNILHYKGKSTRRDTCGYVDTFHRAMLIFFRKHYSEKPLSLRLAVSLAVHMRAALWRTWMLIGSMRKEKKTGRGELLLVEGDKETLPQGHLSPELRQLWQGKKGAIHVVYDVDAYPYEHILNLFAQSPDPHLSIAIYNRETDRVVTQDEVTEIKKQENKK